MILGYARVSTTKDEQKTSLAAQKEQLRAAGCFRVITEQRSAFKSNRRPGWESCKELISAGLVTKFIVVSLARASRRQETAQMSELCNEHNVEFLALSGGAIDVSTPEGFLNVTMQDGINRFDSMHKSLRVRQGMEARRQAGSTAVGRCPFGYRYDGIKPVPDPKQWNLAKRLWKELADCEFRANHVLRHGSRWKFSNSGLIRWMKNPILCGIVSYSDHTVEPLVSKTDWDQCQQILKSRSFHRSRAPRQIRLLSQLVTCQSCERFLNYTKGGHKWRMKCMNPSCKFYGKGLAEWKIKEQLLAALRLNVDQMVALAQKPAPINQQPTPDQIAAQRDLELALQLRERGMEIPEASLRDLRLRLRPLASQPAANWIGWADLIRQPQFLEGMTDGELRAVLLELIDQTLYVGNPAEVKITLRDAA